MPVICHTSLKNLLSDDFLLSTMYIATPSALRWKLKRTNEVKALQLAVEWEAVSEDSIKNFVATLLREFRPDEQFLHEMALSAIAVALEDRPSKFAEKYLKDLANLDISELAMSTRVAHVCLKHRMPIRNIIRNFSILTDVPSADEYQARYETGDRVTSIRSDKPTEYLECEFA